jgi:hypothetical protein
MTTTTDYPEYLITAINDESAAAFAKDNNFELGSWFRVPSTLNDEPEAFLKETTDVLSKYHWAEMSEEECRANTLTGLSNVRILFAKDFFAAARYASARNWWLHAWKFIEDSELEDVIEYSFYC